VLVREATDADLDVVADLRLLVLRATDDGRPLYERAGFEPNPSWMELRL